MMIINGCVDNLCIDYTMVSMLISMCTPPYEKVNFPVKQPQAIPLGCLLETIVITGSDSFMHTAVPGDLHWDRLWRGQ